MSMTREEAIKVLKNGGIEVCGEADRISEFIAALDVALDALTPPTRENELEAENRELKERIVNWRKCMAPTREQAEKVWMGCSWCNNEGKKSENWECSLLDDRGFSVVVGDEVVWTNAEFCPVCGKPLTDEAVEMVMERLEALHGETKTD